MNVQLKGIAGAIIGVILLVGIGAYQLFLRTDPEITAAMREELELHLTSEIADDVVRDAEAAQEALHRGDNEAAAQIAQRLLDRRVEIRDLDLRGGPGKWIVRATYTVHDPDGDREETGYFHMDYSSVTGWRYRREGTSWDWWMRRTR